MSQPIQAVIFDCDGTLVDSEHLANEVFAELVTTYGVPLNAADALSRFRGVRLTDCIAWVEQQRAAPLPPEFLPEFQRRCEAVFTARLTAFPGAEPLVASVAVPICVASSGPPKKIRTSLALCGLYRYFEGRIFSSYDINSWKPEPDILLHAAAGLGVAPDRCVVVEDSRPGVEAALAAGMAVFAFQPEGIDPGLPVGVPVVRTLAELHRHLPQRRQDAG